MPVKVDALVAPPPPVISLGLRSFSLGTDILPGKRFQTGIAVSLFYVIQVLCAGKSHLETSNFSSLLILELCFFFPLHCEGLCRRSLLGLNTFSHVSSRASSSIDLRFDVLVTTAFCRENPTNLAFYFEIFWDLTD